MKRNIDNSLLNWKKEEKRKVLLVRGARQIGKTYSLRELGKSFEHFLEVNFEEETGIHSFFEDSLNPQKICEKLSAYYSIPIVPDKTLLFFDEIQACPKALSSLRFFYEKKPELHVAAAGSLLEFALAEIPSQGVGRITSMFMYPMSFNEYLTASGEEALLMIVRQSNAGEPIDGPFHKRLIDYLRNYQIIGGMPEVVQSYVDTKDLAVCYKNLDDLLMTLKDDFAKYRKRSSITRLSEVFDSIVFQAGNKFKYSNIHSHSSSHALKDSLELLIKAGLAYKIYHTDARGLPLGGQINPKRFKVILFDTGLHQRLSGLDIPWHLTASDIELVNRGTLAEVFAGLELIACQSPNTRPGIYYWHRESRGSSAEVDYVIQQGNTILPIEVKAGTKGQMQSMFLFLNERKLEKGIRTSLENFAEYEQISTIPLYALKNLIQ